MLCGLQRGAGGGAGSRNFGAMRAAGSGINYGVAGAEGMGYAGVAAPFAAATGGAEALGTAKNPIVTMQVRVTWKMQRSQGRCALMRWWVVLGLAETVSV